MIHTTNIFKRNLATYTLALGTIVASGFATNAVVNDYNNKKQGIVNNNDAKVIIADTPISNEALGWATLFTLGLSTTVAAGAQTKKRIKQEKELTTILNNKELTKGYQVNINKNTVTFLDANGMALNNSEYALDEFSEEEIKEIIANALSNEYKPKTLKKERLESPEVKEFQELIKTDLEYSKYGIQQRLMKELNLQDCIANAEATTLSDFNNKPKEIREEVVQLFLEKRKSLYIDGCQILSPIKIKTALLENRGIKIEITEKPKLKPIEEAFMHLSVPVHSGEIAEETNIEKDPDIKETEEDESSTKFISLKVTDNNNKTTTHRIPCYEYLDFVTDLFNKYV